MTLTTHDKTICLPQGNIRVKQIINSEGQDKGCLVFLHEGLGCIEMWKDYPERLCANTGRNGMVYDRIGYGQSDKAGAKRLPDYMHVAAIQELNPLLKTLQIKAPVFVGHSDGGTIALIYAAHFTTTAVITEAAHIFVEQETLQGIDATAKTYHLFNLREQLAKYHGDKTDDVFYSWADMWLSASFRSWDISDLLPKISCPVLSIQGCQDNYATENHLWAIVNGIGRNAKGILLDNCGHNPHKELPDQVMKHMKDFIHDCT